MPNDCSSRKLIEIKKGWNFLSSCDLQSLVFLVCSKYPSHSRSPDHLSFYVSIARFKLFLCRRLQSWFNIWHFMPQVRLSSIRLHRMSKDVRILGFNSPLWKCKLEGFMMTLCKISTIWLEMTSCQARICMMFSQKSDLISLFQKFTKVWKCSQ